MKQELTAERLRELLRYDPEAGALTRRTARSGVTVGAVAGTPHRGTGYLVATVDGRQWLCHRLVWLHVNGSWPTGEIDHINGVRSDNRISNLRDVTRSINQQNLRGVAGVSLDKSTGKWRARIRVKDGLEKSRKQNIGSYATASEAHAAYVEAKRRLHPGNTL